MRSRSASCFCRLAEFGVQCRQLRLGAGKLGQRTLFLRLRSSEQRLGLLVERVDHLGLQLQAQQPFARGARRAGREVRKRAAILRDAAIQDERLALLGECLTIASNLGPETRRFLGAFIAHLDQRGPLGQRRLEPLLQRLTCSVARAR